MPLEQNVKILSIFIRRLPSSQRLNRCRCGALAAYINGGQPLCFACANDLSILINNSIQEDIDHATWLFYPYAESNKSTRR